MTNDPEVRDLLKGAGTKFLPKHQRVILPVANVEELEKTGCTIAILSLRHNFPILMGITYKRGSNDSACIVNKEMHGGKFYYFLKNEKWVKK